MTKSAFVLGGTGMIGHALVNRLVDSGYTVTVGTRNPRRGSRSAVRHLRLDRDNDDEFRSAVADDHDLFVDVIAYNERHAHQLLRLSGHVGSLVVISSAAVYADPNGRMLLGSPDASGEAIYEDDPVVGPVPDGSDYAGGKVAVEERLLASELPVTILRPGAIFGPGDRASREWHFVKRVLDGRRVVPLAYGGRGTFHHISSANLAELAIASGDTPDRRVVNCGDPDPRDIAGTCETVRSAMGHEWEIVPFDGGPVGTVGETPWSTPHPFVLDLSVAREQLGYRAALGYESAIEETCRWLVAETASQLWEEVLPKAADYYGHLFDYAAEDELLERRSQR